MSNEKLAQTFTLGGAKMIALDVSNSVHPYSGADKKTLEEDIFKQPLSPMQDYAQTVSALSGASKEALEMFFPKEINPPLLAAENTYPIQKSLVAAIEKGFNNVLQANGQDEAKVLDNAKVVKLEPLSQTAVRKAVANSR